MKRIISVMLCAVIVLCFSACSSKTEEAQTTTKSPDASQSTTAAVSEKIKAADIAFAPFACSEEYDFSSSCKIGGKVYSIDDDTNSLVESQDNKETTVLSFDSDVKSCMIVGDALYISCENVLYRLPVDDNGDCIVSELSAVVRDVCCVPAYCFENKMAIRVLGEQDDSYILLDTQTGKYESTYDFNYYESSDTDLPSGLISSNEAENSALQKIHSAQFYEYLSKNNYSAVSSVTLVHYPDFYYGTQGTIWELGKHSEYSYMVELVADGEDIAPKFTVYVNAYNSEIQFISFRES